MCMLMLFIFELEQAIILLSLLYYEQNVLHYSLLSNSVVFKKALLSTHSEQKWLADKCFENVSKFSVCG